MSGMSSLFGWGYRDIFAVRACQFCAERFKGMDLASHLLDSDCTRRRRAQNAAPSTPSSFSANPLDGEESPR